MLRHQRLGPMTPSVSSPATRRDEYVITCGKPGSSLTNLDQPSIFNFLHNTDAAPCPLLVRVISTIYYSQRQYVLRTSSSAAWQGPAANDGGGTFALYRCDCWLNTMIEDGTTGSRD